MRSGKNKLEPRIFIDHRYKISISLVVTPWNLSQAFQKIVWLSRVFMVWVCRTGLITEHVWQLFVILLTFSMENARFRLLTTCSMWHRFWCSFSRSPAPFTNPHTLKRVNSHWILLVRDDIKWKTGKLIQLVGILGLYINATNEKWNNEITLPLTDKRPHFISPFFSLLT